MSWVFIAATISAIIGLVSGVRGLRSLRRGEPPQAEITWQQDPLSPWKYETPSMFGITIHTLGLICITVLILLSVDRSPLFNTFSFRVSYLLLFVLAIFAVLFTPFATGVAAAYHFAQSWISPINHGIGADGMFHGAVLMPWKSFSRYEVGPEDGLISLYSSYSPALRTWVLEPPAQTFTGVLGIIQKNLPSNPASENSISWQRSLPMIVLDIVLLVIVPLLPAVWGYLQSRSWVWIYTLVVYFIVQHFGIQLFMKFNGREEAPIAESAQQ
jgi:hypothetical protein